MTHYMIYHQPNNIQTLKKIAFPKCINRVPFSRYHKLYYYSQTSNNQFVEARNDIANDECYSSRSYVLYRGSSASNVVSSWPLIISGTLVLMVWKNNGYQ